MPPTDPLFDVLIYKRDTRQVDSVIGKNMPRDTGFYNAEKRRETALSRINAHYDVAIVEAGRYDKGDVLTVEDTEPYHSPLGSYRDARGVIPYDQTAPKPEVLIRQMRDAWMEPRTEQNP
jgi:hypothetical protein